MTSSSRTALFIFFSCLVTWAAALDCRRFVFAPLCRGISAKRAAPDVNENNLRDRDSVSLSDADLQIPEQRLDEDWPLSDKASAKADDELRAANDHLMLYLLSQVPVLKGKAKGRLRGPVLTQEE